MATPMTGDSNGYCMQPGDTDCSEDMGQCNGDITTAYDGLDLNNCNPTHALDYKQPAFQPDMFRYYIPETGEFVRQCDLEARNRRPSGKFTSLPRYA